jgi:lambda family phage tail tape measure protein
MLQNATLAGLLREKFGKNLAADAEKGLISISSVMEVLAKHMDEINTAAKKLTPTFEQTVTKGIGQLKFQIGELNKELGATVIFADLMSSAVKNLGAIAIVVATAAIPLLINRVVKLGQTLLAFSVSNPWSAAFLAVLTGIVLLINYTGDSTDTFTQKLFKLQAKFYDLIATMIEVRVKFREATLSVIGFFDLGGKYKNDTDLLQGVVTQYKNLAAEARKNAVEIPKSPESDAKKLFEEFIKRQKAAEGQKEALKKVKDVLAELNQEYIKGRINAREYGNELVDFQVYKLNREFSEGKLDLIAYKQKLEELDIQKYNRFLNDGVITLQEYNKMVEGAKIDALNAKVDQGTISLKEYNAELAKISNSISPGGAFALGTQNYLDSIGTTASQTAAAVTSAFTGLETALFEFTKKGTYNFNQFTQAVLDDLLKIIIRASVIQPIAQGLLGFLTPSNKAQTTVPGSSGQFATPGFADGGVFGSGVKMFASGGIVGAPTAFKYGSNKTGVMGEAGPEAILPLSRGPGGQLGVQASVTPVTINITNNTGADVQAKESTGPSGERQIEILIAAKVKEGLASGTYDKTLQQSYGLKRRGS